MKLSQSLEPEGAGEAHERVEEEDEVIEVLEDRRSRRGGTGPYDADADADALEDKEAEEVDARGAEATTRRVFEDEDGDEAVHV